MLDCNERLSHSGIFYFETWWLDELDREDTVKANWCNVRGSNNLSEGWIKNLQNLRWAIKGLAKNRKSSNPKCKVMHPKIVALAWTPCGSPPHLLA